MNHASCLIFVLSFIFVKCKMIHLIIQNILWKLQFDITSKVLVAPRPLVSKLNSFSGGMYGSSSWRHSGWRLLQKNQCLCKEPVYLLTYVLKWFCNFMFALKWLGHTAAVHGSRTLAGLFPLHTAASIHCIPSVQSWAYLASSPVLTRSDSSSTARPFWSRCTWVYLQLLGQINIFTLHSTSLSRFIYWSIWGRGTSEPLLYFLLVR